MVAYKIQPRSTQNKTEIATYVRLGQPSRQCMGFGICEVQALAKSNYSGQEVYKRVVCHISRINDSELIFSFLPKTMSLQEQEHFFGTLYFKVGENFTIKGEIAQSLGLRQFTVLKGTYRKYTIGLTHNVVFSSD